MEESLVQASTRPDTNSEGAGLLEQLPHGLSCHPAAHPFAYLVQESAEGLSEDPVDSAFRDGENLFQGLVIQGQSGECLPKTSGHQASALRLQLLQTLCLVDLESAVLITPQLKGLPGPFGTILI